MSDFLRNSSPPAPLRPAPPVSISPFFSWQNFAAPTSAAQFSGGNERACLWTGSAASWVDLNPSRATQSDAHGVYSGQQVGRATVGGVTRASLWTGSAASWVDLHAFLPPGFTSSEAQGIWNDGTFTYVVGYGYNSTTGRTEALMWVAPGAPPIPTVSEWGLVIMTVLLLTAGTLVLRRQRRRPVAA